MSYIINKTDGSVLTEIVDGTIDQVSTDITLIGKNSTSYGEFFNENLVHLLENFANTSAPNNPIAGQLWFDTTENRLKVYDGSGFKVSGGTVVSTIPPSLTQGDIWIDSFRQQLYFYDGQATLLAGPGYTAQQGITGFSVTDIVDTNQINHTVIFLYVAQTLLGIWSKDAFTPSAPISGYTGSIEVGFNVSSHNSTKIHAPVTQADYLLAADDTRKYAESFLSTTDNSTTTGILSIQNTTPLILGPGGGNGSAEIKLSGLAMQINSNAINQDFSINSLNAGGLSTSFFIDAANEQIGIYTDTPTATLDVNGDLRVQGSLTVEGTLTSINTTNVEIQDQVIELSKTTDPDDTTADGAGFKVVDGSTGKTFTWDLDTDSWISSENINLASGKRFYINNDEILSASTLGNTVLASSLTSVGQLTNLQVARLYVAQDTSIIEFVAAGIADGTITLKPKNDGTVDVSNKRISSVATPPAGSLDNPESGTAGDYNLDAANKVYVDTKVRTASVVIGDLDINDGTLSPIANTAIADLIDIIAPHDEYEPGTLCRVQCIIPQPYPNPPTRIPKRFANNGTVWLFEANL
jgi:hypothetical protein